MQMSAALVGRTLAPRKRDAGVIVQAVYRWECDTEDAWAFAVQVEPFKMNFSVAHPYWQTIYIEKEIG